MLRRQRRSGGSDKAEIQLWLAAKTLDDPFLICVFVRGRLCHFENATKLNPERARADVVQELKELLLTVAALRLERPQ